MFKIPESLLHSFNEPVVFKNQANFCELSPYLPCSLDKLNESLGNLVFNFRIVSRKNKEIAWENNAPYIRAKLSEFIQWTKDENAINTPENPFFSHGSPKDFWAYSSYNYLCNILPEDALILQEKPGISENSAIWLGNEGAYTPCHYDSHGYNMVIQLHGRKKWILFPPSDTSFMYPTRIPYEESSVFSSVNILNPNLNVHPLFQKSHPHVVILEPGDKLFVPKNWWHFVICLETSYNLNTWYKMDSDCESYLEESVTRALMSSFIETYEPQSESWLNAKEELVNPEESIKYIKTILKQYDLKKIAIDKADEETAKKSKITKINKDSDVHNSLSCEINSEFKSEDAIIVNCIPFTEFFDNHCSFSVNTNCSSNNDWPSSANADSSDDPILKSIINCFVHPEVIDLICQKLKELK